MVDEKLMKKVEKLTDEELRREYFLFDKIYEFDEVYKSMLIGELDDLNDAVERECAKRFCIQESAQVIKFAVVGEEIR